MRSTSVLAVVTATMVYVGMGAMPAHADAIDGNWCSDDGRHLSIAGPMVTTPAGVTLTGAYSRHLFRYVAPAGDPDSGKDVVMHLLNETTVRIEFGTAAAQTWHRCAPQTS